MTINRAQSTCRTEQYAHFMCSRERHGQPSNMTFDYPLTVNHCHGPQGPNYRTPNSGTPNSG